MTIEQVNRLAGVALQLLALFKEGRQKLHDAGTVTDGDGQVLSDAELLNLLAADARNVQLHADAILAKYAEPTPRP